MLLTLMSNLGMFGETTPASRGGDDVPRRYYNKREHPGWNEDEWEARSMDRQIQKAVERAWREINGIPDPVDELKIIPVPDEFYESSAAQMAASAAFLRAIDEEEVELLLLS